MSGPWTRHGHIIEGFTVDGPGRPQVARCGGPSICRSCALDAERIRIERMYQRQPEPLRSTGHQRDPEADAVYIQNVGTAFRCECGRYYVGGYGCPADPGEVPPSVEELGGWWHRAAERVVRTYADVPDYLRADLRRLWPSLGDALDNFARIDALAESADDAE